MSKNKELFLKKTAPYGFDANDLAWIYSEFIRLQATTLSLQQTQVYGQQRVFYQLHFYRPEDKIPRLIGFDALLRDIPPVVHRTFNGISSEALEREFEQMDWFDKSNKHHSRHETVKACLHKIWKQLERLKASIDPRAMDVAQYLQMKYWAGSVAEQFINMDLMTTRYDRFFSFDLQREHEGITAKGAYNLLDGRPLIHTKTPEGKVEEHWLQLRRVAEPSRHQWFDQFRFPAFDLSEKIRALPLPEPITTEREAEMIAGFRAGDICTMLTSSGGVDLHFKLWVNAECQSLTVSRDLVKSPLTPYSVMQHNESEPVTAKNTTQVPPKSRKGDAKKNNKIKRHKKGL